MPEGSDPAVQMRANSETIARMRKGDWSGFRESYWTPTILQRGGLAMVWLPYQLVEGDGTFSHCGIDQFTLTKTDTWVIEFASFTIEPTREACDQLQMPSAELQRPQFSPSSAGEAARP
jgi:hypothetical protein